MALHRHAQRSGMPFGQARHIATRRSHFGQDFLSQGQQALSDGGEAQRPNVLFDQSGPIVTFQRLELMGQG